MSKTAEHRLLTKNSPKNEAMFRTLANTINAAVFIYQDTENKYVNRAAVSLTGYSEEELLSMKFWEMLHPDYQEMIKERARGRLQGNTIPRSYEVKIVTKTGEERWLDYSGQRFTYEGRPAVLGTAVDITHHKAAEAALRENEARYRLLADNSTDMISRHTPEGIYRYVSPACHSLLGYNPGDLLGRDAYQFIHPDDTKMVSQFHMQILNSRETFTVTYRIRRQDGIYVWFESTCKAIRNSGLPNPEAIEVVSRDVTARMRAEQTLQKNRQELEKTVRERTAQLTRLNESLKREITERTSIEEALRESEERFRLLAENATDMISKQTAEGTFIYISPACSPLLGFQPHEMQGKNLCDFIFPEDRVILRASRKKILTRPVVDTVSYRAKRKDGKLVWLETTIKAVFERNGKDVLETIAVTRDISERKRTEQKLQESESRYRLLVENSGSPISFLDRQGKILFINTHGAENLGDIPERMVGKTVYDLFDAEFAGTIIARLKAIYESGEGGIFEDLVETAARPRWFWSILRPFKDTNGDIFGVQIVSHDITPLKQAEEELTRHRDHLEELVEQRTRKLQRANRKLNKEIQERKRTEIELRNSREQFRKLSARLESAREEERTRIAREIHDSLGQELTILQMDLSWLENQLDESQQQSLLAKIRTMYNRIDRNIREVQRISQLLRPSLLDNLGLIPAITWQTKDFQKRSGIICTLSIKKKELEFPKDVASTIFRVFQEALTNIFRHAGATRVEIEVSEKKGNLFLQVRDNGRGITRKECLDLNSLGLTGIRERIFLLNGRVEISGEPNRGTIVKIIVPIQPRGEDR